MWATGTWRAMRARVHNSILALDIMIDNFFGGDTSLGPDRIAVAVVSSG